MEGTKDCTLADNAPAAGYGAVPENAAAAKERGHKLFAESEFIGGKPGRRSAAEQSPALLARIVIGDGVVEITVDLLEAHLVEGIFVELGVPVRNRWVLLPEPIEHQQSFGMSLSTCSRVMPPGVE